MKVVIFCGGLGTRLREHSETIPKPLVPIGPMPILWHLMRYYAHFGHKEFILCLGYKGVTIREFFLNYNPNLTRDFSIVGNGGSISPASSDIADWTIHFVDTGLHSNIGQRLSKVQSYLEDDELFLANYGDQLSDLPLNEHIERFDNSGAVAGFAAVRPSQSFHLVDSDNKHRVTSIRDVEASDIWINGGYMVLRNSIFDYIRDGEELVEEPFRRLLEEGKLFAYRYHGFWKAMDTIKDKIVYDRMWSQEELPWQVWQD
ncbi:MAG: sugar phosphate nucleotidyltransferase [Pseudomonadales bacterium]